MEITMHLPTSVPLCIWVLNLITLSGTSCHPRLTGVLVFILHCKFLFTMYWQRISESVCLAQYNLSSLLIIRPVSCYTQASSHKCLSEFSSFFPSSTSDSPGWPRWVRGISLYPCGQGRHCTERCVGDHRRWQGCRCAGRTCSPPLETACPGIPGL